MTSRKRNLSIGAATVSALALLAACSSGSGTEPGTGTESTDGAEAMDVAVAPPEALAAEGSITYCATLDNPPRGFVNEDAEEAGFEVDLGTEMAALMGLEVTWLQLTFDGLISALQADQCDAIVQELFIKPERLEIIDMIPFSNSGQQLVVHADSDLELETLEDGAGLKVGVPNGTTVQTLATEANAELEAAGKDKIDLLTLPTTTDTFHQLSSGLLDAVGTTTTAAAYYAALSPDEFRLTGEPFGLIETGIGVKKGNTEVFNALDAAFQEIVDSGRYGELIEEWNLQGSEL